MASYYADFFAGRKMANGEPMRPQSNNAASRTLPLGTTAIVTNLENGRSAEVEIKDRGPYVVGRIIDVSPGTARELGMLEDGVVRVEVVPLSVPRRHDD
jgi:rare lipoprotein A